MSETQILAFSRTSCYNESVGKKFGPAAETRQYYHPSRNVFLATWRMWVQYSCSCCLVSPSSQTLFRIQFHLIGHKPVKSNKATNDCSLLTGKSNLQKTVRLWLFIFPHSNSKFLPPMLCKLTDAALSLFLENKKKHWEKIWEMDGSRIMYEIN